MTATTLRPTGQRTMNATARPAKTFGVTMGPSRQAHRILIYGPGGIGKSSLAAASPDPIFADIEESTKDMDVRRVSGVEDWSDLRLWLQKGDFSSYKTIVIDSATLVEEWCIQHIVRTVPHDKGCRIEGIEDYGYGKGYVYVFEEWRRLLADLETHFRKGCNIVLIAHDMDGKAPNPDGEDFLRHQPRLQNSEKASIMKATVEWCDHVLFIGYDTTVKDGKAKGGGTRTIFCAGTPTVIAKTRNLPGDPIPFVKDDASLWNLLKGKPQDDMPKDDMPSL